MRTNTNKYNVRPDKTIDGKSWHINDYQARQDKTPQYNRRQGKAEQDKARHDNTRQANTM